MSFEIVGKLLRKYPTESKSDKFQAREFVIEVVNAGSQYPEFVKFQLTQERCGLLDSYNEGTDIKVHFDLRGREWQGKYFTNLNCWRIEQGSGTEGGGNTSVATAPPPAQRAAPKSTPPPVAEDGFPTLADAPLKAADTDDLPF
jgi:single-strand DNA-binding protein